MGSSAVLMGIYFTHVVLIDFAMTCHTNIENGFFWNKNLNAPYETAFFQLSFQKCPFKP